MEVSPFPSPLFTQLVQKRGLTIKGNVDGTVIRNGAAHTRYSAGKKQKQQ